MKGLFRRVLAGFICLSCLVGVCGMGKVNAAGIDEENYNALLDSYFEQREQIFLGTSAVSYNLSSEEDLNRNTYIEEWMSSLDISIENVNIEYSVLDTLNETQEETKLLVYEWVWLDYVCNGYDESENMGFGTYHVITFDKGVGEIELHGDAYSEITGYETGTVDDLQLLSSEVELISDVESESSMAMQNEGLLPQVSYSYNAGAAVSYSNTWCGNSSAGSSSSMNPSNYNPSYYYYPSADCCNFVSQCLYAGGLSMDGSWYANTNSSQTVTADPTGAKSGEAWRYVPTFKTYWSNKGHTVTRITDASQAVAGNPIFYLASDGYSSNHIMLIVGKNAAGQVLINGHNNDAYRYPLSLSSKVYYTLELTHSHTDVVSYNTSTHTLECSICGDTKVEAHTFASTAAVNAVSRCVVCGYIRK